MFLGRDPPQDDWRALYRLRPRETMIAQYKLTETELPREPRP